ncbi:MAG: LemA family protein [Treponema sp.]|nr:LemA family protein [Treponema sp.]
METIMKKTLLIVIGAILLLIAMYGCTYNGFVKDRENVDSQWANVETMYQKRADLVPNLVATVKGFAAHEEKVFTEIAESRSKLGGSVNLDSSITDDPEKFAQFQKAQSELSAGIGRLLALSENYPSLKSNENFLDLQSQLEGLENRISTERKRYNDAARDYNTSIQKFPGSIIANMSGFKKKAYFQAEEKAYKAPSVQF